MTMIRTYSELSKLKTFEERFEYLKLTGIVGKETFGYDRYINQILYNSIEWKRLRKKVILRDKGCNLGVEGYDLYGKIIVHHMNPITVDDIVNHSKYVFDPEFLISTNDTTHNSIHYGTDEKPDVIPIERTLNDTCPWKK